MAVLLTAIVGTLTASYVVVTALADARPDDAAPPSVTITFPANNGVYNAAGWAAGCAPAGICGTATSAGPTITSVTVAIYEDSSGRYWDGSAFASRFPDYLPATGTTSWHYAFSPSANTSYTVYAQASTRFATSRPVSADFTYDTTPPGAPVIISHPAGTTTSTSAAFVFLDFSGPDLTFSCYLDSAAAAPCSGPAEGEHSPVVKGEQDYTGLPGGTHCFNVYATDEAGNVSRTTQYCWTITVSVSGSPFTVGGVLTSPLYPGTSEQLDLTFTNPNSSAITIASGGITSSNISFTTNAPGCSGSNFEVVQGLAASVTIQAGQSTSLAGLGIPQPDWPVIEMINTPTNQDACEGASVTLAYSGIEATG